MDNRQIADRLDAFATLLELSEANPYTDPRVPARGRDDPGAAVPVADLVRAGRARELRGIGPGIEARLRELVETGQIAELDELERRAGARSGRARTLPRAEREALGGARAGAQRPHRDELREAAAAGKLRDVPGIGPKIEAQLRAQLARDPESESRPGLVLNRAWELVHAIAAALDGQAGGRRAPVAGLVPAARGRVQPRPIPSRCSTGSPSCRRSSRSSSAASGGPSG